MTRKRRPKRSREEMVAWWLGRDGGFQNPEAPQARMSLNPEPPQQSPQGQQNYGPFIGSGGAMMGFNPPPPLFPSAFAASSVSNLEKNDDQPSSGQDKPVAEQLFPPGKVSDLQLCFNKTPDQLYIGKLFKKHKLFSSKLVFSSLIF
jgi:hypothetical protein